MQPPGAVSVDPWCFALSFNLNQHTSTTQFVKHSKNDKTVFWGSFIALITTSMAFIIRAILINSGIWPEQFGLDKVQGGILFGAGICALCDPQVYPKEGGKNITKERIKRRI